MSNGEWIAACTVCPWIGVEVEEYEGYTVCPDCYSEVMWESATGHPDDEAMEDFEGALDLDLPGEPPAAWTTPPPEPRGRYQPGPHKGTGRTGSGVVASKPRQAALKGCLAACAEQGAWLRWHDYEDEREAGRDLLLATGRVCLGPGEVAHDPAEPSGG